MPTNLGRRRRRGVSFILNQLISIVMFMFAESVLLPCERAYMYIKRGPQKVRIQKLEFSSKGVFD